MRQLYLMRITFPVILFLFGTINAYAQPAGADLYNAINAGTLSAGSTSTDTKNNSPSNGYGNDIGQLSDDIYYRFTPGSSAEQ
ncbi:MAG TPA: hypothetical protein VGE26_11485 [Sphingobacteriaceae bacterium]